MHETDRQQERRNGELIMWALMPPITNDEAEIRKQLPEVAALVRVHERYGDVVAARLARVHLARRHRRVSQRRPPSLRAPAASRAVRRPRLREIRGTRRARAPGGGGSSSDPDLGDRPGAVWSRRRIRPCSGLDRALECRETGALGGRSRQIQPIERLQRRGAPQRPARAAT